MINLYPDQMEVVNETREQMRRHKSVLVQAATGFGKTILTAYMIKAAVEKGSSCMMVVPRRELLRQTAETFIKFGIPHTYVSSGYKFNPFINVVLATAGTLVKRLDKAPVPKILFVDETHFGAGQLNTIISHYKERGSWIIGLSATPERLDGRGLGCWYETMVEGPSMESLIDSNRLSDFRMFAPDTPDLSNIRKTAGDYAKGELADKMEGDKVLVGNAVKHYKQHANGLLDVAFTVSVKHAEIVAQAFRDEGVPSAAIHGAMKDDERSKIIKAFARREIKVLTSVDLLTFGFDLASAAQMDVTVEALSDLAPTQSTAKQMQKWGRALRMKDNPAIILDHAGNAARHGMPDNVREWTLEDREKEKSDKERLLPVRQCDQCYFVHTPQAQCPNCGYVYPIASRNIEETDGELIETINIEKEEERKRKVAARQEQGQANTLEGLIALGKKTGKKPGWAQHVYRARQRKRA
jgi:superfamily II DNA or RNA helicase